MRKLKQGKELTEYKESILLPNCPLCGRSMRSVESSNRCLDHDHKTGIIRDVLCRNCNGIEGKIYNLCTRAGAWLTNEDFLQNVLAYWNKHYKNPRDVQHPNHGKIKKRGTRRRKV